MSRGGPNIPGARSVHFTLSAQTTPNSSRSSSPASSLKSSNGERTVYLNEKEGSRSVAREKHPLREEGLAAGRPMDVYDATMPRWRASLRRQLVKAVTVESQMIARMQVSLPILLLSYCFHPPCCRDMHSHDCQRQYEICGRFN